jgi:hypothetical protein
VVGAPFSEVSDVPQGKTYIFVKPAAGWNGLLTEAATLQASDGLLADEFGEDIALSADGRTIVVGADWHATTGAVYLFTQPEGGWSGSLTESARLSPSDPAYGDRFGSAVAISGDTIAVGAYGNDVGGNNSAGTVYLYVKPPDGWATTTEDARLIASDGAESEYLGDAVAIDGDTVVAGAEAADWNRGAAYLFEKPASGWSGIVTETAKLTASDGRVGDLLGEAVVVAGDTVVVGTQGRTYHPTAAYVYVAPPDGWRSTTESARLLSSDGHPGDSFGLSLAVRGAVRESTPGGARLHLLRQRWRDGHGRLPALR